MLDDESLNIWFCQAVLPLERALTRFISRNWRVAEDVVDIRQEIYERALLGAREALPLHSASYLFTVARNHLINRAKHERIVSFELVADLESIHHDLDLHGTERHLDARDELRRVIAGLEALPPRCREAVRLRKVEGLSRREAAERMGVTVDTIEVQLRLGIRALADYVLGGSGKIVRPKFVRRDSRRAKQ